MRCCAAFSESWHFLVDQYFLVASSLLNRWNLIYPKKFWSTLHNNTDKGCGTWSFVDQNIETSRVLNLHSELQIYFLCKTFYQWKLSTSVQVFFLFGTLVYAWLSVTLIDWASSTEVICTWPTKHCLYLNVFFTWWCVSIRSYIECVLCYQVIDRFSFFFRSLHQC